VAKINGEVKNKWKYQIVINIARKQKRGNRAGKTTAWRRARSGGGCALAKQRASANKSIIEKRKWRNNLLLAANERRQRRNRRISMKINRKWRKWHRK
jgi:hypothetical protein